MAKKKQLRLDSFTSFTTKLGDPSADKKTTLRHRVTRVIGCAELESLYYGDGISANIVDVYPEEMLRKGFVFTSGNEQSYGSVMHDAFRGLEISAKLDEALKWARLYGGAALLLGVNDGLPASKPIDFRGVKTFSWVNVLDRYQLEVHRTDRNPLSKTFGQPYMYRISGDGVSGSKQGEKVHASRVIPFFGTKINDRMSDRYEHEGGRGWGASVLQRAYAPVLNYVSSMDNVATMIQEYNQATFQVKGLMDLLADEDKGHELLMERLRAMQISRSVVNALLLDEDEQLTTSQLNLRGLSENLESFMLHVAAVSRTPVTRVFGQAPAGLNATGEHDERLFFNNVAAGQTAVLQTPLERIARLVMLAKRGPFGGEMPKSWAVTFPPVAELTEIERAALRKTTSEADGLDITNGLISAEEARRSRYGGAEYSTEITIAEEESEGGDPGTEPDVSDVDPYGEGGGRSAGGLGGDELPQLIALVKEVAAGSLPASAAEQIAGLAYPHLRESLESIFAAAVPGDDANIDAEDIAVETKLPANGEKPIPIREAAEAFGLRPARVRALLKTGALRAWKFGANYRVLRSELETLGEYTPPGENHDRPQEDTPES